MVRCMSRDCPPPSRRLPPSARARACPRHARSPTLCHPTPSAEGLARKMQARLEFDQTIQETEAAYMKILESSQTLLGVLKRESSTLTKKKQSTA